MLSFPPEASIFSSYDHFNPHISLYFFFLEIKKGKIIFFFIKTFTDLYLFLPIYVHNTSEQISRLLLHLLLVYSDL